jgi:hypothetical protein
MSKSGYCQPVEKKRKSDNEMKDFIYGMLFEDIRNLKCNCKQFNGQCIGLAGIEAVGKLRDKLWGNRLDETVRTKDKGKKLEVLLRPFYNGPSDTFQCKVGDLDVCERGFFMLLGLLNKSSKRLGVQITRVMNTIRGNIPMELDPDEETKKLKKDKDPRSKRSRHAVSF